MTPGGLSKRRDRRILSGSCPDPKCQARLFFPASGSVSIECTECGQRHEQQQLLGVEEVTDPDVVLHNLLRNALLGVTGAPKKNTELVKVMGLSNYHCKLLSPILARYGMDKQTGRAKLLRDMNQGELFDCALLGDRAFLIEPEHVNTVGYGKDRSGSLLYLHDTLEDIKRANKSQECLIPVHVDGDGHCLVSRPRVTTRLVEALAQEAGACGRSQSGGLGQVRWIPALPPVAFGPTMAA